ncbi:MAG: T9SS type A sorting domain-containing protein [Candidatus Kapaibacteriales bacterium]
MKSPLRRTTNLSVLTIAIFFLSFLFFISIVDAKKNGISGLTSSQSTGCDCHSNSPSNSVVLSVQSQTRSFIVQPGSTTTFTLTVANPNIKEAGVNIAVKTTMHGNTSAETLAPASGEVLKLVNGELTHSQPKICQGGEGQFSFQWTAPTTPGQYFLRAIALAGNNNGKQDNADLWNWLAPQVITVEEETETKEIEDLILLPNQFNPFIFIKFASPITTARISILDIDGKIVKEFQTTQTEFLINLLNEQLPSSTYYMLIEHDKKSKIYKFIYAR